MHDAEAQYQTQPDPYDTRLHPQEIAGRRRCGRMTEGSSEKSNGGRCPDMRTRVIRFAMNMDKPMTSAEIVAAIGGRGVSPNRIPGFLKGCEGIEYIPEKTVKTGPNAGRNVGAGKWMRKPVVEPHDLP